MINSELIERLTELLTSYVMDDKATQDSLREHMALLKHAQSRIEELEAKLETATKALEQNKEDRELIHQACEYIRKEIKDGRMEKINIDIR